MGRILIALKDPYLQYRFIHPVAGFCWLSAVTVETFLTPLHTGDKSQKHPRCLSASHHPYCANTFQIFLLLHFLLLYEKRVLQGY